MKADRNDPCPCGSGKKYKTCHGRRGRTGTTLTRTIAPLAGILLVAGGLWAFLGRSTPSGRVWSEEHGHWHDAPGATPQKPSGFTPPPPGEAPEGKVWSYEHGHWHDVVPTEGQPPRETVSQPQTASQQDGSPSTPALDSPAGIVTQPPGPAPEGKVWSAEHGHWHDIVLTPQPPGPVPEGKVWSAEHGHWHDAPVTKVESSTRLTPQPPGPAPEGKVWVPEHGHWHDATRTDTSSHPILEPQRPDSVGENKPPPDE
jgi:hypothetical protein